MRLRVVHWNAKEVEPLLEALSASGHTVELTASIGSGILKQMRALPPDAVVIDLSRQPSHEREVAVAIRAAKTLKHLPILFLDGEPEKVEAVRRILPDRDVHYAGPAVGRAEKGLLELAPEFR